MPSDARKKLDDMMRDLTNTIDAHPDEKHRKRIKAKLKQFKRAAHGYVKAEHTRLMSVAMNPPWNND